MLDTDTFANIVKNTPLISIDLLVFDRENKLLLGWRVNSPAKNTWFVPGGRITKDETIHQAFKRISKVELGKEMDISEGKFLGVYEHIYPNENFGDIPDFSTHYIVLGFRIDIDHENFKLPHTQHNNYKWLPDSEVLKAENVHQNVKNYLNGYVLF